MRPTIRVTAATALAIVSALSRDPSATLAADGKKTSPYYDYGPRDAAGRAARHHALGVAAAAAGDRPTEARQIAMECVARTVVTADARMTDPSCAKARQLARDTGLLDVQLTLDGMPAELKLKALNPVAAEPMLAAIIARGAAIDPASPDARPVRRARLGRAVALTQIGLYGEATAQFALLRDESRQSDDDEILALAHVWDCWNQMNQGELERADAECQAARDRLAQSYDSTVDFDLTYIDGQLRDEEGDYETALTDFRRSVMLSDAWAGGDFRGPVARTQVASALTQLGRLAEARVSLEAIDRDVASGKFFRGLVPLAEHQWAKLERAANRPYDAMRHFERSTRSPEYIVSIAAHRGLAWARRQTGDLPGARTALEEAIRRLETRRLSVAAPSTRAAIAETHASVYRDLVSVLWDLEGSAAAPAALEIAEAGRARALLDALASSQVAGAGAPTLTASAVQATLHPDEVLVEYVSADDRLLAVTVTRSSIALTALPQAGSAEDLARRVDFFSALVQQSDETTLRPAALRLEADILAPALDGIPATTRTLLISPDGALHRLPFDALGASPRVIDRWDVVTVPSATVLASRAPRAAPSAAALVVAAPAGGHGLGPLPAAPAEAAAVRRRLDGEVDELLGADATRGRLDALRPARFAVLHFASHALVDQARPLRSALVLAPATPDADGRWTADAIYRTTLGADLVVLSACATAAGAQTSGEGVMSLARAFLYAGAGATVATLWDVPDAPGPVFADVLYAELAAGRPLGPAVADARRELRRRGAPPRAWASYVLTGNPAGRVRVTGRVDAAVISARVAAAAAILLLLAAAATRLRPIRGRVNGRMPALAGASLAVAAVALLAWPARQAWNAGAPVDRGGASASFAATIADGRVRWSPVAGADEYRVELFDADGVPVGPTVAAADPFPIPAASAGRWIRLEARRHRDPLVRSELIRLPVSIQPGPR